jgi:cobalt transporter subunit CbtB
MTTNTAQTLSAVQATAGDKATGDKATVDKATGRTKHFAPILLALAFGVLLIGGAGLANSNTLHNAAHDARHAFGMPCH